MAELMVALADGARIYCHRGCRGTLGGVVQGAREGDTVTSFQDFDGAAQKKRPRWG